MRNSHLQKKELKVVRGLYSCCAVGLCQFFTSESATCSGSYPAYFGEGTKLTVLEPGINTTAPNVTVFKPSPKECRNPKDDSRKKTLLCVATGFYPDHVTVFWQIDKRNITKGVATNNAVRDKETKKYKITSRLRVPADDWHNPVKKNFSCVVAFFDGKTTFNMTSFILGEEFEGTVRTRGKYLRTTHTYKLSYTVFIVKSCIYGAFVIFLVWKLQGSARKWND